MNHDVMRGEKIIAGSLLSVGVAMGIIQFSAYDQRSSTEQCVQAVQRTTENLSDLFSYCKSDITSFTVQRQSQPDGKTTFEVTAPSPQELVKMDAPSRSGLFDPVNLGIYAGLALFGAGVTTLFTSTGWKRAWTGFRF